MIFAGCVLAFLLSALLAWSFSKPGSPLYVLDHPNHRSLHSVPTPRFGGLALFLGVATGMVPAFLATDLNLDINLVLATSGILIVSLLDDRFDISAKWRLMAHTICASWMIYSGLLPDSIVIWGVQFKPVVPLAALTTVFIIVWMTNLYNFMDGMDGFAGGMTVIGFGTIGWMSMIGGSLELAVLSWLIMAASAGFLIMNFPPARIFLGDAGSATLGFLASIIIIRGHMDNLFPAWLGFLVFSPFIVDATITISRRIVSGEKFWKPHRSHYYQRLVGAGWSHRKTVLWEYGLMILCAASALAGQKWPWVFQYLLVGAWTIIYIFIIVLVNRVEKRTAGA